MREGVIRDHRSDVRKLGALGLEELAAGWDVVEEVADRDRGAEGQTSFLDGLNLAAVDLDNGSGRVFGRVGFEPQA